MKLWEKHPTFAPDDFLRLCLKPLSIVTAYISFLPVIARFSFGKFLKIFAETKKLQ